MAATFVGRAEEKAALEQLWASARAGSGPVAAVIVGDPGAGKSRLLSEFTLGVGIDEQIHTSGYELERRIPLATAQVLMRRLRTIHGDGDTVDAVAFGSTTTSGSVDPVRLFEAVHRALMSMGPVLLVADDLHWADEMSVALFHYLVRAAAAIGHPLALVVATRPSPSSGSLRESLQRIVGTGRFADIELGPLDRDAGIRLALDWQPQLDENQAALVWRRAEGSPFWLEVLAQSESLDADVDRVVAGRLRAAGDDATAATAVMCLAARPLAVDDIARIQGWEPERAEHAMAAAEHHGIAVRTPAGVIITHDLIREAAGRAISVQRAGRLHRLLGHWLESCAGNDDGLLLEALEHRHAAGEPTVSLALRLTRSPRRRLLGQTGLHRLMAIADGAGSVDPDRVALEQELAELAFELGRHDDALRLWCELAWRSRDAATVAHASLRASQAALELGRRSDAWLHLERARTKSGGDAVLVIEMLAHEAALQRYLERRPDEARITSRRALDLARALVARAGGIEHLDDPARRACLRATLAAADGARMGDDAYEMLALAEEVTETSAGLDDRVEISALVQGAMALRFLGRNTEAEMRLRQAWDAARRRVLPQAVLEAGAALGRVLLSMGRLEETEAIVRECTALGFRLTEFRPGRTFMVTLPWLLGLSRGEWRQAADGLRVAAETEPEPHYRLHAHLERAAALARLDPNHASDEIRVAVAAALTDAETATCRRCLAEASVRCGEALARIGDVAAGNALASGIHIPATDAHNQYWRSRAEAAVAAASATTAATATALQAVIAEAERQELHLEAVWARLDLGAVLGAHDRSGAASVLHEAGAAAERMGAVTEVRVADQLLRSNGVRTWRRGAAMKGQDALSSLTGRERDIARLVAGGASNPEIGSALFLSRKTVERHVSNILAKMGVRNRAGLAALVPDEPDITSSDS